jgi:dienelactone hydrolase
LNATYLCPFYSHAFMNDEEWSLKMREHMKFGSYDEAAVKVAWERVLGFFSKRLF